MSNNTPILVTGAAGNVGSVGRGVVKLLRERDLQVRALVHRLDQRSQVLSEMGAELVVADLTNGSDVVRALHGCKRMYFGMSPLPQLCVRQQVNNIIDPSIGALMVAVKTELRVLLSSYVCISSHVWIAQLCEFLIY